MSSLCPAEEDLHFCSAKVCIKLTDGEGGREIERERGRERGREREKEREREAKKMSKMLLATSIEIFLYSHIFTLGTVREGDVHLFIASLICRELKVFNSNLQLTVSGVYAVI